MKKEFKDDFTRRLWHKVDFGWVQDHELACYKQITKNLQDDDDLNELWYQTYLDRVLSSEKYLPPEELPFIAPEDLQNSAIEDNHHLRALASSRQNEQIRYTQGMEGYEEEKGKAPKLDLNI